MYLQCKSSAWYRTERNALLPFCGQQVAGGAFDDISLKILTRRNFTHHCTAAAGPVSMSTRPDPEGSDTVEILYKGVFGRIYRYPRNFFGCTENTEVSVAGIEVVPNLPMCQVSISISYRAIPECSVGYWY